MNPTLKSLSTIFIELNAGRRTPVPVVPPVPERRKRLRLRGIRR